MQKINCSLFALILLMMGYTNLSGQQVAPILNSDGTYGFNIANIYFEVDPSFGSRISSFKLGDEEIINGSKTTSSSTMWGSTFWQSPQSEWNWPPSVALDQGLYKGGIVGNKVSLLSGEDKTYNTHLTFRKTFSGNLSDTSVTIVYTIINNGTVAHSYSGWEITRVPSGGMAFFPYGEGNITGEFANQVQKVNNIAWWEYEGNEPSGKKYFSDGKDGWDGWLSDNDVLYLRKFDDVPSDKQANGEKEIELYFQGHTGFIELEIQSQYTPIAPKDSLVWEVKWFLRKLPVGVSGTLGSESLIDYVNTVLNRSSVDIKNQDANRAELFSAFPNPSAGKITFQSLQNIDSPTDITIYNLQGQVLMSKRFESKLVTFDPSDLSVGFYLYEIKTNLEVVQTGKLLLCK